MANIIFPRKEIEKHLQLNEKNLEAINMFGIPAKLSQDSLEVEIFPNRPDLLSMQGFIRAIKSYLNKPVNLKYKINKPLPNYKVKIDSSVKQVRPFTACAIVKNLRFDDAKIKEIIDVQEKLHATIGRNRKKLAIGIYPLEKIKLPITYEARKPDEIKFMPLDYDKELTGKQILQKHPTGREYAHLLQDSKLYPIFIDADNKILSMPPIINSQETGKITQETKDIFIECSGFDQLILNKTLNILVTTLADIGGSIYQMQVSNILTPDLPTEKIKINLDNINKLLGLQLKESQLPKLLAKMQIDYKDSSAIIPAWRTDILHEVDIIEDIAIAYGYQNLIPEIPRVATIARESKESRLKSKIAELLAGLQMQEISTLHLIKKQEFQKAIEIINSKTDYKFLRQNLLIPALRTLSENTDNTYPQKIFELGAIFKKDKSQETNIKESLHLLIAITPGNFTEIKQILDYLFQELNIQYQLKESSHKNLIDGRTASILMNNKPIGYLGELHPQTLHSWHLKLPASVLELSLDDVFDLL